MMNKAVKSFCGCVSIMLVLAVLGYTLIKYVVRRCWWWECVPSRSFRVADLDIPNEMYPENTDIKPMVYLSEEFDTIDDGAQLAYWHDRACGYLCSSSYGVLRYPSLRTAKDAYSEIVRDVMTFGQWDASTGLSFVSTKADQVYLVCGQTPASERCVFVARYQEYVIDFNSNVDAQMTRERFDAIVAFIDRQIVGHLYP